MKKYILLALVSALILPVASRAEAGSDSAKKLPMPATSRLRNQDQSSDYFGAIKIKLEDGKLVTERETERVESTKTFQTTGKRPPPRDPFQTTPQAGGDDSKTKSDLGTVGSRFGGLVDKLERLTMRVEAYLETLKERGMDTAKAQEQLKVAKAAIADAKAGIATLPRQLGILAGDRLTSTNNGQIIRTAIQKVLALVKTANSETQVLMKMVRGLTLSLPQAETAQPR